MTPFGRPPIAEEIPAEMVKTPNDLKSSPVGAWWGFPKNSASVTLFGPGSQTGEFENATKTLISADSANIYSAVTSCNRNAKERVTRICLAMVRDLSDVWALSFTDKDFTLSDCGTKTAWASSEILLMFYSSGSSISVS